MYRYFLILFILIHSIPGRSQSNASFTVDSGSYKSLEITFVSNFTDSDTLQYTFLWDFGDGTTGTRPVITHLFPDAGTYLVSLTVTGPNDSDQYQTTVTVKKELVVPNVFTPNEDGLNDLFVVKTGGNVRYVMTIFSRSGYKLAKLEGSALVWDGKLPSGQKATPGVYYYIISDELGLVKSGFFHIFY